MADWEVESYQLSDTGLKRRHNEDYVACRQPHHWEELASHGRLYVLADGVGGAAAGEIVSRYAVDRIVYGYYQDADGTPSGRLRRAIEAANADVYARNRLRADQREMATTVVAAIILGDQLTVANVGDSRAYLVRPDGIEQITSDHSLVAEMVLEGAITPKQAETHPYRHVILRSVGSHATVKVDIFSCQLALGYVVVLCSDGLTRQVSDEEIAALARAHPPCQAAQRLVALANARGGEDNITVSISRIVDQHVGNGSTGSDALPRLPNWDDL